MTDAKQGDYQQTVSGESTTESEDDKKYLDKTPFSTKTSINETAMVVEGETIYVSKHVLGLVSPVFRAMFELDMAEKKMDEIPLPGKRLSDMIEFLLCVYPDTRKPITEENAVVLVPLFTEYQVDDHKAACEQILTRACTKNTDIDTIFERLLLSITYNTSDLRSRCIEVASNRNTNTLRQALRKYDLPDDVKIELWEKVTMLRDSEIESFVFMCDYLPTVNTSEMKRNVFRAEVSSLPNISDTDKYIKAVQTAGDHGLLMTNVKNVKTILSVMFAANIHNSHAIEKAVRLTNKLPKNIKDILYERYAQIEQKKS